MLTTRIPNGPEWQPILGIALRIYLCAHNIIAPWNQTIMDLLLPRRVSWCSRHARIIRHASERVQKAPTARILRDDMHVNSCCRSQYFWFGC
jgi:hypothetical protein